MIERIDSLPSNLPKTVETARIRALLSTYSQTVGVDLFRQTVDGEVTAVFGGMDGSFSLLLLGEPDYSELRGYFAFCGAVCFCAGEVAERLNPESAVKSKLYCLDLKPAAVNFSYCNAPEPISSVYDVLKMGTDGDIALPPFELWYTDFCARYNHASAEYAVIKNATAVAGFMTDDITLITGVSVAKSDRNKGLGRSVLGMLIHNIRRKYPNSEIFASTLNAGGFYERVNFKLKGTVALCKF